MWRCTVSEKITKGAFGAAGIIAVLTIFSRFAGLLRKLAQSWAMSDGLVASAYDTANTVPNVLFEVAAGGALAGAVIPLISGYVTEKREHDLNQTLSALITWILLISMPVAVIVALNATAISFLLFGAGTDLAIIRLAAILLQLFVLQIPLYGLSVVFTGVLQAHGKFVLPALSPLLSSIVVIGVFSLYAQYFGHTIEPNELNVYGILLLGLGTTLGVVVFSVPQLFALRGILKFRFTLQFPDGVGRRAISLAGAGLAALIAQQIAIVVIMYVANSAGGVGAYTTFNYSYTVFMVPYAVLAVPVATAVFPKISAAVAQNDQSQAVKLVRKSTQIVLLMGMVAACLLISLALPAKIVLEVGRNISGLDYLMQIMAGGLVGFSLLYHVARVLYALGRGRKVVFQNTLAWGVVCLCLLIFSFFGVSGRHDTFTAIGVSLTVGLSVGAIFSLLSIRQVLGRESLNGVVSLFLWALIVLVPVTILATKLVLIILASFSFSIFGAIIASLLGGILLLSVAGIGVFQLNRHLS